MKINPLIRSGLVAGVLSSVLALGACASSPEAPPQYARLVESDGRVEFVENRISDKREQVLRRAATSFGLAPQCSLLKSGLVGSRRAITVEDCIYELQDEELAYAGTPIEKVTYRFVDDRLFQMQFAFKRVDNGSRVRSIGDSVSEDLQLSRAIGASDSQGEVQGGSQRWTGKSDIVELLQDPAIGTTALQISDAQLLARVIAQR